MHCISTTSPLLILVVDDSATSRVVIGRQLKKLACEVITACDGASALATLAQHAFDLVLLDCQMPDVSGYEVARRFRKTAACACTPIIAISAASDALHLQRCAASGIDGVLEKPLPPEQLQKTLSTWCESNSEASSVRSMASDELRGVDLAALFRSTSLDDFAAMQASVQHQDLPAVGRLAHRMKGAALTMGAGAMVCTLERIEVIAMQRRQPLANLPREVSALQQQLQRL